MTSERPAVSDWTTDFDHTDPQWSRDPYPIWEDLRGRCPLAHSDRFGGTWLPVTHELITEISYDTENFTSRSVVVSEQRPTDEDLPAPIGLAPPITSDPPFHHLARRLLLPAFSPKRIEELTPFTRDLCNELIDELVGCESVDAAARAVIEKAGFMKNYGLPGLPHRTGHGIGLEGHEWTNFVKGNKTLIAPGMCFSDEPTIAIPGEFGIRLEDCLYVTEQGPRFFSKQSKSIEEPFG